MLRVRLFGRPRLSYGDAPISAAARPKVVPLLAYLLLHPGPVARRTVAAALWPDHPDKEARANLRRHLNYLQHLLPNADHPWLLASASEVGWNPEADVEIDVAAFEALTANPHRFGEAIALYDGDLLAELDEEWLLPLRERLRALFLDTVAARIATLRAAGDPPAAIAAAQRLLIADPWREDTLRALMTLRYESGDRAGALADFEGFARRLHDELDTEPMPETIALKEAIVREALPANRAPPVTTAPPAHDGLGALPFIGRANELELLAGHRRAAERGRGALVLVGGESGVGKTRLVREFAVAAESAGAQVYAAPTTAPEAIPYQPFADLLRAAAPLLKAVRVDPLWVSAVATIAPSVSAYAEELPPLPPVEPARERGRLFEACADVWEALATRRPLVLIVEDVHRAGAATLAMLEHLAQRAASAGILVLATYREDDLELAHPLRTLRRRLEHDGIASHIALPRLSRQAVDELVTVLGGAESDSTLAPLLYERSEGNPFFLGEILRDLHESGRLRIEPEGWALDASESAPVPFALRDAIASRLARLDERAAALVDVAAVVGRGFDAELLRETTGWLEATVLDALDALIERRIIIESTPRSEFGFAHNLIQAVAYDALAPATRARRHRRVAQVMTQLYEAQHDDLALALALHWELGNEQETASSEYLRAARRALSVFANDEADEHLVRSLRLGTVRRSRFEALLLRERIASARGDRETQGTLLDTLGALARTIDDEDGICTVLERRIERANVTGDRRAERVLLQLLERRVRRSGETRWNIRALAARARYLRSTNAFEEARAAFEEVIALAQQAGDNDVLAAARLAYADTYIYEGRLDEARGALHDLRAAVEGSGNLAELVRTLMSFARAALVQQDYGAMSQFAEDAHHISAAIGDREGEALALHTLANGLGYTFKVAQAGAYYRRAMEIYERIGHRVGIASISVDDGLFHTQLGLLDRALVLYTRARDVAAEIGFRWVTCVEAVDRSYALRLQGVFPAAKEAAEFALAVATEMRSQPLASAALGTLGAAESALGAHADAIAHLEEGVALRRPAGATPRLGENLCALALAYLRNDNIDAAVRASTEMLDLYDANPKLAPQPSEWLWAAAQVEQRCGNGANAQSLLHRADSVMRARASAIEDPETRVAFAALPFNRAVTEALAVV